MVQRTSSLGLVWSRWSAVFLVAGIAACSGDEGKSAGASDCTPTTWYRDVDGDGAGDATGPYESCEAPAGHVADASDCNDQDPAVFPGAVEVCNGVDDDCDGTADNGAEGAATVFYADTDGDGFGDPDSTTTDCAAPAGFVEDGTDCDDTDPTVNPEGEDLPRDGIDGDCDGADATTLAERAFIGDLNLLSEADIDAFCEDYDGVVGDLQVAGAGLPESLALPCLVEVTGDFVISADNTVSLSLPELWYVGGELRIAGNPSLGTLGVEKLRFVDGALVVLDNAVLNAPVFPVLESVGELTRADGGDFVVLHEVRGNLALAQDLTLNALETVGGSVTIRDGALRTVALPGLVSAGDIELRSVVLDGLVMDALQTASSMDLELPALSTDLEFPVLASVAGSLVATTGATNFSAERLQEVGEDLRLPSDDLADVSMPMLSTVGGAVQVGGAGLERFRVDNLSVVGDTLDLTCLFCEPLDFSSLATVGGDLSLHVGNDLETLELDSLVLVGGGLVLDGAHRLRTLAAPILASLGGPFELNDLEFLETIDLSALESPAELISMVNLPSLIEVDLSALRLGTIRSHLQVRDNPLLTTLSLGPLIRETGSLTIEANPQLSTVDISSLETIGALVVSGEMDALDPSQLQSSTGEVRLSLDSLESLDLGSLEVVGGDLSLGGTFGSTQLGSLTTVGGSLSVNGLALTTIEMPLLEDVFVDLSLEVNEAATVNLDALQTVGGSFLVLRGSQLTALAVPALDTVGKVTFDSLPMMSSLSLDSLVTAGGNVELLECDALSDLDGLATLQTVSGSLTLIGNDLLDDVSGLSGITSVGGEVVIQGNTSLSTADAWSLVYDDIGEGNIGGGIAIVGNAP